MPANPDRILEQLRKVYLQAEQSLFDALTYKRSNGLIDYSEQAALERVQRTLANMQDACWRYVPILVESSFYVQHPEKARLAEPMAKHLYGYANAGALTIEQTDIVETLTANLMSSVIEASRQAELSAHSAIGRLHEDQFRKAGVASVAQMEAAGGGTWETANQMMTQLRADGVTAYVDKAGRRWGLYAYCNMVTRTTSRQAVNVAVLTKDPDQDLFKMSRHGTTCPACAPYEGRVYSKSGNSPDYPPLSAVFGKVDRAGPEMLTNSYLNIHPNCLHTLTPYSTIGMTQGEIERDQVISSFRSNPPSFDPRSDEAIKAYRQQQAGRQKYLRMLHEYQRYRMALGDKMPKTAQTFIKHKMANDQKYKQWKELYSRL
ncbi:phage minor capsid protein [Oscillibacter sp.]|uniref:phage minor capsid protein n=1 Tax=Oscillibacter sp. TaxID=1945593 RepID=UPI00289EC4D4|nr:phage minor capsid protein [Oscillibacter sp.]